MTMVSRNLYVAMTLLLALTSISSVLSQGTSITCTPWTIQSRTVNFQRCLKFGDYTLNWILSGTTVTIGFSYPTKTNYVAIAFTKVPGRMIDSNAIVGRPTSSGVVVQEYFLRQKSPASVAPASNLNASGLAGQIVGDAMQFIFTVSLTPDKVAFSSLIWTNGPYRESDGTGLQYHPDGTASQGTSFSTGESKAGPGVSRTLRNSHGLLNGIAWGVLIPLGIIVARHGKRKDPGWYYFHLVCQSIGLLLGLIGFITGFVATRQSKGERPTHKALAVFILILGITQLLALCLRPHKGARFRGIWEIQHHWSGRAAVLLGVINVYVGLNFYRPAKIWTVLLSIIIAIYGLSAIGLELWRQLYGGGLPDGAKKTPFQNMASRKNRRDSSEDVELQTGG